MTILEAGEHAKEIITQIRRMKQTAGHKLKDLLTVYVVSNDFTEDNLMFYYYFKDIIERQCNVKLQFQIAS